MAAVSQLINRGIGTSGAAPKYEILLGLSPAGAAPSPPVITNRARIWKAPFRSRTWTAKKG